MPFILENVLTNARIAITSLLIRGIKAHICDRKGCDYKSSVKRDLNRHINAVLLRERPQ